MVTAGRDKIVSRYLLSTGPGFGIPAVSARLRFSCGVAIAGLCRYRQVNEVTSQGIKRVASL